jgi:hypothetical protein
MTIAHRFALTAPGAWHVPGATSWEARDTRLDARVIILISDSADTDAEVILARLTRVRAVRDPRLARVVDVGIADVLLAGQADEAGSETSEAGTTEPRAYVALAALTGISAETMVASRILPASLARLVVRSAAEALGAAKSAGLAHGALSAGAIAVNNRGRLIVAGAGLLEAFGGDTRAADAADAGTLASLFARAVLGFDTADKDEDVELPDDLAPGERRIVSRALRGKGPASIADLLAALGSTEGATLAGLPSQIRRFAPILAPEPEVAEPEFAAPGIAEPGLAEPGLAEHEARQVDTDESGEPHARAARPIQSAPRGATPAEIEEWELEHLLEEQEAEEIPTLAEAILDFLHRRFPTSTRITGSLEAAHARALRGPRVNGARWTVLLLLVLLTILGYVAFGLVRKPYVPTDDLNNAPAQTYPAFTFYPSPTSAPPP